MFDCGWFLGVFVVCVFVFFFLIVFDFLCCFLFVCVFVLSGVVFVFVWGGIVGLFGYSYWLGCWLVLGSVWCGLVCACWFVVLFFLCVCRFILVQGAVWVFLGSVRLIDWVGSCSFGEVVYWGCFVGGGFGVVWGCIWWGCVFCLWIVVLWGLLAVMLF